MKKLLSISIILLSAITTFAQFPNKQILSPSNAKTLTLGLGGLGSDSGFIYTKNFTDTTTANAGFLKNIVGITIRVGDTLYMRANCLCEWKKIGSGGISVTDTALISQIATDSIASQTFVLGNGYVIRGDTADAIGVTDSAYVRQVVSDTANGLLRLSGTEVGKPVTGDIEVGNNRKIFNSNIGEGTFSSIGFEDGSAIIISEVSGGSYGSTIAVVSTQIAINSNYSLSKGLIGNRYFGNNADSNTYIQYKMLTDSTAMLKAYADSVAAAIGGTPTLQQVTTAGHNTTDTVNVTSPSNQNLVTIYPQNTGGGTYSGSIIVKSNSANRNMQLYNSGLYFNNGTGFAQIFTHGSPTQNSGYTLPDSSGLMPLRTKINGITYEPNTKGTIDLGTISGGSSVGDSLVNLYATKLDTGRAILKGGQVLTASDWIGSRNNSSLRFRTNGVERLVIDSIGRNMTFMGMTIGKGLGAANDNTVLGVSALENASPGQRNTAIGTAALSNNTGVYNTAVGYNSLPAAHNGTYNSSLGMESALFLTGGTNNVFLGARAGSYISGGVTSLTNATTSTFIGYNAMPFANNQTNQTVIGFDAVGIGSNSVVLGNDAVTTTALKGSVGIGTTTPAASSILDLTSTNKGLLIPRMSNTLMEAISSPAGGLQVWNSTYNCPMYNTPDFGWWSDNNEWIAQNGVSYRNDFFGTIGTTGGDGFLIGLPSGTNAVLTNFITATGNHPGSVVLNTGTTATGAAVLGNDFSNSNTMIIGGGVIKFEQMVQFPTLSTSTERYAAMIGLNSGPTFPQTKAISFLYDSAGINTGAAASPNWQVVTANAGTRSYTTTSVVVTAGTWYKLTAVINATGTSVDFYINGTLVKTETTNMPTATLVYYAIMRKSAGITARTMAMDYFTFKQKFTTPR